MKSLKKNEKRSECVSEKERDEVYEVLLARAIKLCVREWETKR